ncbi:hypothetical protein ACFLU1_05755 [Chloroflexota bacterium]
MPNLERFIEDMQDKLPNLDFEGKRLALDMLGISVWLDGQTVEVTGTIEPELQVLRCTHHPDVCSVVASLIPKRIETKGTSMFLYLLFI